MSMAKTINYTAIPRRRPEEGIYTFRHLLERECDRRPDVPIFSTLDYASHKRTSVMPGEFISAVEGLAAWLYESGKNRKVVGILGPNSYEWLFAFYGAQYAGCIVLLLDRTADVSLLEDQIVRSGCKDVIYSEEVREKAESLASSAGVALYSFDKLKDHSAEGRKILSDGRTACLDQTLNGDDTAVIMYTSGTTGISKGVMLSSKNLLMNSECVVDILDAERDQVLMLPLNHIYSLLAQFLAVRSGKCLHICLNLRHMADDFAEVKPELLFLVPLIIKNLYGIIRKTIHKMGDDEKVEQMIRENKEKGNVSYEERRKMFAPYIAVLGGRIERIVSGGAPIDIQVIRGMEDLGIPIQEGYGITECSPVLAVNPDGKIKVGTVGIPTPGHEMMIDNPDKNGIGEICAKGPSVMNGYYNMEKETAEAMAGGWFHTGDLGYLDEESYLTITGRIKNLIILSNGENISPEELEAKIYLCRAVSEVIVYEKDDKISAMIYMDADYIAANNIADGEAYVRAHIEEYNKTASTVKKISAVEFRDVPFEKTSSNKIKRNISK